MIDRLRLSKPAGNVCPGVPWRHLARVTDHLPAFGRISGPALTRSFLALKHAETGLHLCCKMARQADDKIAIVEIFLYCIYIQYKDANQMQLWVCLRLSELSVQCLNYRRPEPLAIVEQQRVYAVNPAAGLLGVEPGLDPTSARALAGDQPLQLLPRDPDAEKQTMDELCCWGYGLTPHLHRFRNDCLMLEISSSLRLLGGVEAIVLRCQRDLACRGFRAEIGVAPTALAAWVCSHLEEQATQFGQPLNVRLAPVPLTLLEPLHGQFESLGRSGLHRLGEVFQLSTAALAKRCGRDFGLLLQELCGAVSSPRSYFEPPSCFQDSYPLGYPVSNQEELGPALEQLLVSLQDYLRQRQLQTRTLHWHFSGHGGYREILEVRTSAASNSVKDWYRLTKLRLERQPFTDEVDHIQLRAEELEVAQPLNGSLFTNQGQQMEGSQLVDMLSNRLGTQAVNGVRLRDAHLPEHSLTKVSPGEPALNKKLPAAQRPFWLLPEPEPLGQHQQALAVWGNELELIHGPERIEDEWWDKGTSRDYFIARNDQGQRFWVFHERRLRRWFLHGFFA